MPRLDREKVKFIVAFALIAVVVLLLCIPATRSFFIGVFGYAVFAYVIAVFVATLLLSLGKRIVIEKKKVALYLALFFSIVVTLHIVTTKQAFLDENRAFVNTQFAEYLWGPFADYETVGGVIISMLTFYAVPMGYVASLIIFFIAAAALGLLAIWPLLVYREKPTEKKKLIVDVESRQKEEAKESLKTAEQEELFVRTVMPQPIAPAVAESTDPIVVSRRPSASDILFNNAEQPKEEKKELVPTTLKRELTDLEKTYVMDRSVVDSTLPQNLQLDADRAFSSYDVKTVYTGCEEPTSTTIDQVVEQPVQKTNYDEYLDSIDEEDRILDVVESENTLEEIDNDMYYAGDDSADAWDMGDVDDEEDQEVAETKVVTVVEEPTPVVADPMPVAEVKPVITKVSAPTPQPKKQPQPEKKEEQPAEDVYVPYVYTAPPLSMLAEPTGISGEVEEFSTVKERLDSLMANFKIEAEVVAAIKGPTVTRYELSIGPTVNVNRFEKIKDNIAMRLKVESVLILAPIPGKDTVGIEVPNPKRRMVGLREIIGSQKFILSKGLLDFALGTTVDNEPYFFDLAKAPHMLVAGSTNSGKSCGINSMLISLLYKYSPEDLRLILIDPKRVELLSYSGLPHMLIPNTICEVDKAVNAIKWLCGEMDRRYTVLSAARVVNIKDYNELCAEKGIKKMANIVLVVDEMADLMLRARNSIEENICRIAAVGRACGIHLVVATQRPDATVITGLIKSNIPTCVAFAVKSAIESNIILGQGNSGAKSLLGTGDALFMTPSMNDQLRFQGAFVSSSEVRRITDFIRDNNKSDFDKEIEDKMLATAEKADALAVGDDDDEIDREAEKAGNHERLCIKVLKSFIIQNKASVSMVQSQHGKGYVKALKIVDTLTKWGCISPQEPGGKARRVLITMDEFKERFGDREEDTGVDDE